MINIETLSQDIQASEERSKELFSKICDLAEGMVAEDIFNACGNMILATAAQAPDQDARNEVAGMMRDIAAMLEQPVDSNGHTRQ